jgi:hypothetical protein
MSNNLIIQVFGPFRRDQFVAALDAINSEEGAWIERHRIPHPVFRSTRRTSNVGAWKICDAERCDDSLWRERGPCDKMELRHSGLKY